jgi:hypothetical protein
MLSRGTSMSSQVHLAVVIDGLNTDPGPRGISSSFQNGAWNDHYGIYGVA